MGVALGCTHYIHLQRAGWKHWGPPEVLETIPSCYVVHQAEKDIVEMSILKLESYIRKRQSGGTIHLKVWQARLTKCMTLDWSLSCSVCVQLLSTVAATVQLLCFCLWKDEILRSLDPPGDLRPSADSISIWSFCTFFDHTCIMGTSCSTWSLDRNNLEPEVFRENTHLSL